VGGHHLGRAQDWLLLPNAYFVTRRRAVDRGERPGATTDEQARVKAMEREVKEPCRSNEILRKASAHFSQAGGPFRELDRRGS
jgi:transposase